VKRILLMTTAATIAACAHAPAPAVGPAPAPAPASPAADRPQSVAVATQQADTGFHADSARKSPAAPSDSARVSESEVTKRAAEVFGDSSTGRPTSSVLGDSANGPSWDIDVHSYETTERVEH